MKNIGVIGLGAIGVGVARSLLRGGFRTLTGIELPAKKN
jgi:3-hydroxyisobutyrate dehydrogenase-like beta-hydroxyacid dehydrogenase